MSDIQEEEPPQIEKEDEPVEEEPKSETSPKIEPEME